MTNADTTQKIEFPIRATADQKFIRRYLYIVIACLGVILWCIYDLQVTYPSEIEKSKAYYELIEGTKTEKEKNEEWTRLTNEKGWSLTEPDRLEVVEGHVTFQYWIGGICLLAGIGFLAHYLRSRTSWVEADKDGLTTSWGRSLKFDQIERINKRKWEKKGIVTIVYKTNKTDEMERTFKLDDLKFSRIPTDQILETIEATLSDEQIVGGKRESGMKNSDAK